MLTRQEILSSDEPLIFKSIIDFPILSWSVEEWKNNLGNCNKKYPFREGYSRCSEDPLWETNCETKYITMGEFFEKFSKPYESDRVWLYFDYKHISEWFGETLKDVSWNFVGFPERYGKDSTLWIGTEGANTPCHMDSYGCNLVAQLYGKKMWLLFDPSKTSDLLPTRVPYEESSIYSRINFSCTCHQFPDIREARCVTLEPGDVLYIPNHWWHYVENITSAISINTWIPVDSDDGSRIEESLVKCFVSAVVQKLDVAGINTILNPNERDLMEMKICQNINELNWCVQKKMQLQFSDISKKIIEPPLDYKIPVQTLHDIVKQVKRKCKFPTEIKSPCCSSTVTFEHLINAFCHPDVIEVVKKTLFSELTLNK